MTTENGGRSSGLGVRLDGSYHAPTAAARSRPVRRGFGLAGGSGSDEDYQPLQKVRNYTNVIGQTDFPEAHLLRYELSNLYSHWSQSGLFPILECYDNQDIVFSIWNSFFVQQQIALECICECHFSTNIRSVHAHLSTKSFRNRSRTL